MKKINFWKYTSSLWVMAHACVYGMGDENNALMLSSRHSQPSAAAVEVEQKLNTKVSFLNLPDFPLSTIIRYLEPKEIGKVAGLCKDLKNLVANYEAYLFFEVKRILNQKLSQENGYFKYYRGMSHFNQNRWLDFIKMSFNDYIADQTKPVLFDSSFIWFHKLPSHSFHDEASIPAFCVSWNNPLAASYYKATCKLYRKLRENADETLTKQSKLYKSASEINDDTPVVSSEINKDAPVVSYVTLTAQEWTENTNKLRNRLDNYFKQKPQTTLVLDIETGEGLNQIINNLQVQKIALSNANNVTTIENDFLLGCWNLQSIDLSGLSNVTTIGNYFLSSCWGLKSIDLSGLSNVTTIGNHFIRDCSGLKSIDLSGLSNVTTIEHNFLSFCSSLKSIDLTPLRNVTIIGDDFLSDCNLLQSIDLSGLSNVTTIGNYFLRECNRLQSIDLSGLSNVTTIGDGFMWTYPGFTDATLARSMENGIVHRKLIDIYPRVTITWIG